ncbi:MAG: alpha/beta fold hydrolase [Geminicoccaceae bacterium]
MQKLSKPFIDLASQTYGDGGGPIVILHGLLGSGRNWTTIAKRLGNTHRVHTLDLRNHGNSPWTDEMSYELMAGDVGQFIETNGLGPVVLIGHSMGGKTAMRLALNRPSLVEKLVVVDIAPVDYEHGFGGYVEAMQAIDIDGLATRSEVDDLLAATVPEAAVRAFLLQNLVRQDQGFVWRANLQGLAEAMPALMTFPASDIEQFANPAIVLAGMNSDYVQAAHQAEIHRLFPKVETRYIADAGHWLHAEQPTVFLAHLKDFLSG